MPALSIHLDGDNCWPDLHKKGEGLIHLQTPVMAVAALTKGMKSGKASVAIRVDLPDGKVVVAETSMRLFLLAADAFRARFGDQTDDPPQADAGKN